MSKRRPRNEISRNRELALRAAELYDDGKTDFQVSKILSKEFKKRISKRTAGSFYRADYEPILKKRLERIEGRRSVELILEGARGVGATYAEAAQDILSKLLYDMMTEGVARELESADLVKIGKSLAKIRQIELEKAKFEHYKDKESAAKAIKEAMTDKRITTEDVVARVDEIMGLKKPA